MRRGGDDRHGPDYAKSVLADGDDVPVEQLFHFVDSASRPCDEDDRKRGAQQISDPDGALPWNPTAGRLLRVDQYADQRNDHGELERMLSSPGKRLLPE